MHQNRSLKGSSSVTLNVVLDLTGTPQLIVIKGENVMILHQQFASTPCLLLGPTGPGPTNPR